MMRRALLTVVVLAAADTLYLVGWDAWNSDRNWFRQAVGQ
jgi:hypothetical protein